MEYSNITNAQSFDLVLHESKRNFASLVPVHFRTPPGPGTCCRNEPLCAAAGSPVLSSSTARLPLRCGTGEGPCVGAEKRLCVERFVESIEVGRWPLGVRESREM